MKKKWLLRERSRGRATEPGELLRRVGIHARTGARCSCSMCGNPRRHFGDPTVQERRAQPLLDDGSAQAHHVDVGTRAPTLNNCPG